MVKYQCPRCNFESDRIAALNKHINNKKLCPIVIADIIPNENNIIIKEEKYMCNVCNNSYNNKSYLKNHKCSPNINNNVINLLLEKMNGMENTLSILVAQQNNITVNAIAAQNFTNNNSSMNVFVLNDFEKTKIDHITATKAIYYMNKCMGAIPKVIEDIHYNPDIPENHNAYITNRKTKSAQYLNEGKWITMDGEELAEKMMLRYHANLFHTMSDNPRIVEEYPNITDSYNRYYGLTEGKEKKICNDIMDIMYNNREMCIETQKQLMNR